MSATGAQFLHSRLMAEHGVIGLFSLRPHDATRHAGELADAANLPGMPHQARQTHDVEALTCRGGGQWHDVEADILIGLGGAPVAVRTADCTPVLLADVRTGIVAAVHAGWRGTAKGVALRAVDAMRKHDARPEHMLACIGPCIGPCCFEIGGDVADALSRSAPNAAGFVWRADNRTHADLAALNALHLEQAGLRPEHIERLGGCTCCDARRFFSWRRDGPRAGRHLAVVASASDA